MKQSCVELATTQFNIQCNAGQRVSRTLERHSECEAPRRKKNKNNKPKRNSQQQPAITTIVEAGKTNLIPHRNSIVVGLFIGSLNLLNLIEMVTIYDQDLSVSFRN